MNKITAIVPAYNEEGTVGEVVKILASSPLVGEVIVVSDGSEDKTADVARAAGARVIELPFNHGKGGAMGHGAVNTDAEIIAFFDADLFGLRPEHIELLAAPVLSGRLAMSVGIIDRGPFCSFFSLHLPLISGLRVMRRDIFTRIPTKYTRGFMVEIAMNYFCRSRGLKYGGVILSGLKIKRKTQKVGIFSGLWEYLAMFYSVGKALILVRVARLIGRF